MQTAFVCIDCNINSIPRIAFVFLQQRCSAVLFLGKTLLTITLYYCDDALKTVVAIVFMYCNCRCYFIYQDIIILFYTRFPQLVLHLTSASHAHARHMRFVIRRTCARTARTDLTTTTWVFIRSLKGLKTLRDENFQGNIKPGKQNLHRKTLMHTQKPFTFQFFTIGPSIQDIHTHVP